MWSLIISDIYFEFYGNGIKLPEKMLKRLMDKNGFSETGYKFKIFCEDNHFEFYVNVVEFTSEDGQIILPNWMISEYRLERGSFLDIELVTNVSLGKFICLQPQDEIFFEMYDYETCLEQLLPSYSMLQKNKVIVINMFGIDYRFIITEIRKDEESQLQTYYESKVELEDEEDDYEDDYDDEIEEPDDVICIINVDLTTDIHNKFLEEQLQREHEEEVLRRARIRENNRTKKREKEECDLMSIEDTLSNDLKHLLGGECKEELSKEEMRRRRLARFG